MRDKMNCSNYYNIDLCHKDPSKLNYVDFVNWESSRSDKKQPTNTIYYMSDQYIQTCSPCWESDLPPYEHERLYVDAKRYLK